MPKSELSKNLKKFRQVENLAQILYKLKNKGKKIVLCHGVFDLLHIGHLNHLEEAKKFGDILVVSLTKDQFINKGVNRPIFKIKDRIKAICSLQDVDYVTESPHESSEHVITKLKPNFYIKGQDYKKLSLDKSKKIKSEKKAIERAKGKIIFTKSELNSSSKLLFDSNMIFPLNQKKYLLKNTKNVTIKNITNILDKIEKLKILVIGETIIDKYIFCESVGKASKEPMLVLKENYEKTFLGGAASIAQNIRGLSKHVDFLSEIGSVNNYKNFIFNKLKNVKKIIFQNKNISTIEKKRYVDEVSNSKILGVYNVNDIEKNSQNHSKINFFLSKKIKNYDLVVVSDYGHGLFNKNITKILLNKSKNLFVNCQINANNRGSHSILKYKGVKNLIINESELRYEMRDNHTEIKDLVKKFSKAYKVKTLIVTKGSEGILFYKRSNNLFLTVPAFANNIVDKVGTGDVMLATISLFFSTSKNYIIGMLAGSMFGAKSIEKYGNEQVVSSPEIKNFFSTFLKR